MDRRGFERWYRGFVGHCSGAIFARDAEDGDYGHEYVRLCWEAWQASRIKAEEG